MHQSQYLPWPPLVRKIATVDTFVLMDSVQFQKNGVQNRNKIRNANGGFWLTIPVTGKLADTIADKPIADDRWTGKHWKSLEGSYATAPYWERVATALRPIYEQSWETLGQVNEATLKALLELAGVTTPIVTLSSLDPDGSKSDLVLDACRKAGATTYVTGRGALDYLDSDAFEAAGIEVAVDDSVAPTYDQGYDDFVPELSIVDMLARVGPESIEQYLSPA